MAVKEDRDDPKKKFWHGFAKEAFDEGVKNMRFRTEVYAPNKATRTLYNSSASILAVGSLGTFMGIGYLMDDLNEYSDAHNAVSNAAIDAVEDSGVENGVVLSDQYVAVRQGDEFMMFERRDDASNGRTIYYEYIEDAEHAQTIAQEYLAQLEAYQTIADMEEEHGINIELNDDFADITAQHMSQPYSFEGEDGIFLKLTGAIETSIGDMSAEIQTQTQDWQAVYNSIADGGYEGIGQDRALVGQLPDLDEGTILENWALGSLSLIGLAFAGGAGLATGRRLNDRRKKAQRHKPRP